MQPTSSLNLLMGSEKQVRWAEDIRTKAIQALQDRLALHLALDAPTRQSASPFLEEAARRICNRQPALASWWINHRDHLAERLQRDLEREANTLAVEYRTFLLASIRAQAAMLNRTVRRDVESLSLNELASEEAIVLRLAGIRREGRALGR